MVDSRISKTKASGIAIYSDDKIHLAELNQGLAALTINLTDNTISDCGKDGVELSCIALYDSISMANNKIASCGSNGLAVVSCSRLNVKPNTAITYWTEIRGCQTEECKGNGILVEDTCCFKLMNCTSSRNGERGVLLQKIKAYDEVGKEGLSGLLQGVTSSENKSDGIAILDSADSSLLLDDCISTMSGRCGVLINTDRKALEELEVPIGKSRSVSVLRRTGSKIARRAVSLRPKTTSVGTVTLRRGRIDTSKAGGISVFNHNLYIEGTLVTSNTDFGLSINSDETCVNYCHDTLAGKLIHGDVLRRSTKINIYAIPKAKASCGCCTIV